MPTDQITIRGAREHNLKNVTLSIPRDKLVVFTGLSGSGKSSLAFDTIYAEGQRRYVESLSSYARQFLGQMEKPDVDIIEGLSPAISIDQKGTSKNPRSTVGTVTEVYDYLRLLYARVGHPHCPVCGREVRRQTVEQMADHVEKLPKGMRVMVLGPVVKGRKGEYRSLIDDVRKSGFVRVRVDGSLYEIGEQIPMDKNKKHDIQVVVDRIVVGPEQRTRLVDSIETAARLRGGKKSRFGYKSEYGHSRWYEAPFEGVIWSLQRRYEETQSEYLKAELERYMSDKPCPTCRGRRLKPESLAVTVAGRNIADVSALSISASIAFFDTLALTEREQLIARQILKEIRERLQFMIDVGLDYLTIERASNTLSGGESQRIRLATQIGSKLMGGLYILDEPRIGLHQRGNGRLINTLLSLRDLGNTRIVVGHDEETIRSADHMVAIGPAAGRRAGT